MNILPPGLIIHSITISNPSTPNATLPNPGPSEVPGPPVKWSLNTTGAVACGYVMQLLVYDLTIYNENKDRYWIPIDRGFCLMKS